MDLRRTWTLEVLGAITRIWAPLDTRAGPESRSWVRVGRAQNLFEIEPMEIYNTQVVKTLFQGDVVYERN